MPRDYVPDMRLKIDLYRRLTRISGDRDLQDFRSELIDRFGPLPTPAERLLSLVELKIDAAVWQFHSIHLEGRDVVLSYANRERAEHLERLSKRRVRVIDEEQAYLRLPDANTPPETIIATLKSVLRSR